MTNTKLHAVTTIKSAYAYSRLQSTYHITNINCKIKAIIISDQYCTTNWKCSFRVKFQPVMLQ